MMYIEQMTTDEILREINNGDKKVAYAVEKELQSIARVVNASLVRYNSGGRIIYCGAGSSGRIAAMDAIEMLPTYNVSGEEYLYLIAGGEKAMFSAAESVEDDEQLAIADLENIKISHRDVLIAVAASGKTPYCSAALEFARDKKALTVALTCVKNSLMSKIADLAVEIDTGMEIVEGSTRLKAGTAQKMVLNMLSTTLMIQTHKVYHNMMIQVRPTNKKLKQRAVQILQRITGASYDESIYFLDKSNFDIPRAIIMKEKNLSLEKASRLLEQAEGDLSRII